MTRSHSFSGEGDPSNSDGVKPDTGNKKGWSAKAILLIETVHNDRTEWGISLDGHNPSEGNYIECPNKEFALYLKGKLEIILPCS